jgi:hypothetical protein
MSSKFWFENFVEEIQIYFDGNIETDLKKIEYVGVKWDHRGQGRLQWRALVNT